jgi:hypothetical protein
MSELNNSIDNILLKDYMDNFFGYGNLDGDYWFIGMEEGGGGSIEEIQSRLAQWKNSNQPTLLDNYEFHKSITDNKGKNFDYFFKGKKSKYQRTWGGLIKILLNYQSTNGISLDAVKEFQSDQLGRYGSNNCIMEVFPLPSPKSTDWKYNQWSSLESLINRVKYKEELKAGRIEKLNKLINQYNPTFVVFFSSNPEYIKYWSEISQIDFNSIPSLNIQKTKNKTLKIKIGVNKTTTFVITHHPVAPGITDNYFKETADRIRTSGIDKELVK